MRVIVKQPFPVRLARRFLGGRAGVSLRSRRSSAVGTLLVLVALWLTSVLAIAEYWKTEVPAVRAVGARATAHRVLALR